MGKHSNWNSVAWRKMARIPARRELWPVISQLRAQGYTPDEAVAEVVSVLQAEAEREAEAIATEHVNVVCDGHEFTCSDTEPHTHYQPVVDAPVAISQVVIEDKPAKVGRRSQFARHPVTGKFLTKEQEQALEALHELQLA